MRWYIVVVPGIEPPAPQVFFQRGIAGVAHQPAVRVLQIAKVACPIRPLGIGVRRLFGEPAPLIEKRPQRMPQHFVIHTLIDPERRGAQVIRRIIDVVVPPRCDGGKIEPPHLVSALGMGGATVPSGAAP